MRLKNIYVKSTTGAMVPLSAVTHFETQRIPLAVNHQSQSPAATLSFNLTPGASLSQATAGDRAGAGEYRHAVVDSWRICRERRRRSRLAFERAVC